MFLYLWHENEAAVEEHPAEKSTFGPAPEPISCPPFELFILGGTNIWSNMLLESCHRHQLVISVGIEWERIPSVAELYWIYNFAPSTKPGYMAAQHWHCLPWNQSLPFFSLAYYVTHISTDNWDKSYPWISPCNQKDYHFYLKHLEEDYSYYFARYLSMTSQQILG